MEHELATEGRRLHREVARILEHAPVGMEVPVRIHGRDIDGGGGPAFHPEFLRYIDQGVCGCGRVAVCAPECRWAKDHILGHLPECQPACTDGRFHASNHRNSPTRMKRAMRQVRKLNPRAYDFVYLVVALHYPFEVAAAKLNQDNALRGLRQRTLAEYAVLWVSGASLLVASF